jgi:hypothetical protein
VLVPTIKQTTEQLLAANPGTRPALFLSTDNWNPDAWTHIATKLGYRLVADDESLDEGINIGQEWMSDTELDQYVPDRLQQQWRELLGYDRNGNPSAYWANLTGGYEPDVNDPQHRALMVKVANKWFAAKKIPNVKFFDVKDADDELEWLVQIGQQGVAEGSSSAKYKIKSIGHDTRGDYYISPSTGKKVYKSGVKVGDHENPKTGEHKGVAEGGYQHGFADPNAPSLGQRRRDHDSDDDEPQGMFTVVINGRPWKEFTSNKAFQVAKTIATKYPDKQVQVKWPSGQLNTVKEAMLPTSAFAGSKKNKLGPAGQWNQSKKRPAKAGDLVGGAAESVHSPAQQAAIAIAKKEKKNNEDQRLDPHCWKGYRKQGTKMKGDTRVNNCVPVREDIEKIMAGYIKLLESK